MTNIVAAIGPAATRGSVATIATTTAKLAAAFSIVHATATSGRNSSATRAFAVATASALAARFHPWTRSQSSGHHQRCAGPQQQRLRPARAARRRKQLVRPNDRGQQLRGNPRVDRRNDFATFESRASASTTARCATSSVLSATSRRRTQVNGLIVDRSSSATSQRRTQANGLIVDRSSSATSRRRTQANGLIVDRSSSATSPRRSRSAFRPRRATAQLRSAAARTACRKPAAPR